MILLKYKTYNKLKESYLSWKNKFSIKIVGSKGDLKWIVYLNGGEHN